MKIKVLLIILLPLVWSCDGDFQKDDVKILDNSPVVSNVPGAFSYIEKQKSKSDTVENRLDFEAESIVFSLTIIGYENGNLGIKVSDAEGESMVFDIKSNTVVSEIMSFNPTSITLYSVDFSGSIQLAIAED